MSAESVVGSRPLSQLLRIAVLAGVESAVQLHIRRGDDLNSRDASGMTPLMLTAARNKVAICRLLLNAGADHGLRDPSGKTAREIAITAGSLDVAALLDEVGAATPKNPPAEIAPDPAVEAAGERFQSHDSEDLSASPDALSEVATSDLDISANPPVPEQERAGSPSVVIDTSEEDGEFDLSGWESEEIPTRPQADLIILDSASAIQSAITLHHPIDSSIGWDDIDAILPEMALPLARADEAEGRALLRRLLLRAIREGRVPSLEVQAQAANRDRSANPEAEAFLSMIINDLGAEVDERFEYLAATESSEASLDLHETPDEETELDGALAAIDRAASPRYEPLRIYQQEFQRLRLLTAEEEVQLGQAMEAGIDAALDALASWQDGIALTLSAGADAIAGARQLSAIWTGDAEAEPATAEDLSTDAPLLQSPDDVGDDDSEATAGAPMRTGEASFADALRRVSEVTQGNLADKALTSEIRRALTALRLSRRFLFELADAAIGPAPCPAFVRAMASLQKARDRMTTANLKLAFSLAKKGMHSGEPLEDLAQEANIGLLKAVDRYDWRRGFRFSTYATWWIRQQVGRYIADKSRTVRLPAHLHEKVQKMEHLAKAFEKTFSRELSVEELAKRMEMPAHRVTDLRRCAQVVTRIDDIPIDAMIAIDAHDAYVTPDPADVVTKMQMREAVDRYISSLSTKDHKEERILRMRYGIGIYEALTLEEVGLRFGVTRERIRQIEAKAIRRLSHPVRSEPFARLVLGLEPEENPLAFDALEPDAAEGIGVTKPESKPEELKRQAQAKIPRRSIATSDSSKPSTLDRLLAQATELGISVDDGRLNSGSIWVWLLEPRDNTHRRLIRKLLELGFSFQPGKGYWK